MGKLRQIREVSILYKNILEYAYKLHMIEDQKTFLALKKSPETSFLPFAVEWVAIFQELYDRVNQRLEGETATNLDSDTCVEIARIVGYNLNTILPEYIDPQPRSLWNLELYQEGTKSGKEVLSERTEILWETLSAWRDLSLSKEDDESQDDE